MVFRKTEEADVLNILKIIKDAQDYFRDNGINQWQNNYPNADTIHHDIINDNAYVLVENEKIVGTVAVVFTGEKTYDTIYNGKWLSNEKYATIHRIAINSELKGRGLSSIIIHKVEEMCKMRGIKSIKVDTHRDNASMQRLLNKNGFQYCGIIYLEDKSERLAFEKVLY
jgi:GNAT superfamily N-acetyltransferase